MKEFDCLSLVRRHEYFLNSGLLASDLLKDDKIAHYNDATDDSFDFDCQILFSFQVGFSRFAEVSNQF